MPGEFPDISFGETSFEQRRTDLPFGACPHSGTEIAKVVSDGTICNPAKTFPFRDLPKFAKQLRFAVVATVRRVFLEFDLVGLF